MRVAEERGSHELKGVPEPVTLFRIIRASGGGQYSEHLGRITLHYEHFYCGERDSFCNASGCLHEVYISSGGHYRLLRSYYAPN